MQKGTANTPVKYYCFSHLIDKKLRLEKVSIFPKITHLIRGTARTQAQDCPVPEPLLTIPTLVCLLPSKAASSSCHGPLQAPSSVSHLPSSFFSPSSTSNPSSFSLILPSLLFLLSCPLWGSCFVTVPAFSNLSLQGAH